MIDYIKIGLKCGIEIHQELDSHKLFCNCPSTLRTDRHDIVVKRRLKPVVGELGKIDVASLHEAERGKHFIYETYSGTNCEIEIDEYPPMPLNKEALDIALEISLLLNAKPVDYIQVMRKTITNGSCVSGFQRSLLLARNGFIKTSFGIVRIPEIYLEEDAARKIRETEDSVTFRLDRAGIPLVEIATAPEIRSPEQAREVASFLGMVLRSTDKVKHGIGTIRQDVNLSIKKGTRVEIKGVQDLNSIPKVIKKEVERQLNLIQQGKKLKGEVRKANSDNTTTFLRPLPGKARLYPETDLELFKITERRLKTIKLPELIIDKAIKLEKNYKINAELARLLVKEKIDFVDYIKKFPNIEPSFIAKTLVLTPKDLKKRYKLDPEKIKEKDFEFVFSALNKQKIPKSAVEEILVDICEGKKINLEEYKTILEKDLEEEIKKIVKEKKNLTISAYMGLIMAKYKGKIDGKKVMETLKKLIPL